VRKGGVVLVVSVMAVIAGCSSGGGILSGSGGGSVAPGHGSPKAAVEGFITDLELGNGSTAWCSYMDPADQQDCQEGAAEADITVTGRFGLGNQVIDGTEALVVLTGDVCTHSAESATTTSCVSNNNPNDGLPPGAGTFSEAYANAVSSSGTTTAPCIEIDGQWYINISGNSGTPTTSPATTSPATTTPTTTPTSTPSTTPTTTPSSVTTTPTTVP
jgi:hypothetical protein